MAAGRGEEVNPIELPLCGERVKIRPFEAERDFDLFTKWFADINGRYFPISRVTSHTASFNDLISNESNIIGVITLLDDSPIGSVTFLDYDRRQQKAELKKLVGQREKRGMGLAKEATKLWIEYGIRALGLKKIYLNTLFTNVRNIRLNEDLGFQVEGILRNEIFFEGKHYDVLRMGLWRD